MTFGPLILAGGAEFDERMAEADRVWLAARRKFRPRVGVFPTANTEHPDKAAANGVSHFRRLVTHSEPVMVTTPDTAGSERVLNQLPKLDYAYFAGGSPTHLAEVLSGSPAWRAMVENWRRGMGLGGSSAGAMVMCQAIFVQERWAAGLAVVPGAVCLPHFNRRDQAGSERARQAVSARGFVGLGIDESTALVWTGENGWRVAGRGTVSVLTESAIVRYEDGASPKGLPDPSIPDLTPDPPSSEG
jgi:cyanophycinase